LPIGFSVDAALKKQTVFKFVVCIQQALADTRR
jgi:hypothetical protein